MPGLHILILASAAPALPPRPPIIIPPHAPPVVSSTEQRLLTWHPGEVRCEGGAVPTIVTLRRPLNSLIWGESPLQSASFAFAIDEAGRPFSIRRESAASGWMDQAPPALAASRFAPGAAKSNCRVSYSAKRERLREATQAELASYVLLTRMPALPKPGFDRLREGDGCIAAPGMQPLVRVYPDTARIPATPGVPDWTLVGFAVDPDGKPFEVRNVAGTGNAALDAAAVEALAASRFSAGPLRRNCTQPFRRAPATLAAPPPPEVAKPQSGPCARDGEWAVKPQLVYPHPYRMRAIEGWAVLSYDVAPWGAIGNVQVVDAQPSEDFGTAAKTMLERARQQPGPGATGCRTRVRYAMAAEGAVAPEQDLGSEP